MLPRLEVVADKDRVEPDLLGKAREVQQLARPELFGRRLISKLQQRLLLSNGTTTETQRTPKSDLSSSRRKPGASPTMDTGFRRYDEMAVSARSLRVFLVKTSYLRQHILAEAPHVGDHRVGGCAFEIEIDIADAEVAERPQIADDIAYLTGEQPPLAIVRTVRQRPAPACDAVGESDLRRIAPNFTSQAAEPIDPALEAPHRIEPVLRVGADRVPAIADPRGAAQCPATLAADPDGRIGLLHRLRLEQNIGEFDIATRKARVILGPQLDECV